MNIKVVTDIIPCTSADLNDPEKVLYCAFIGGLPVIKEYQAQLVTALISPGSSGSAVYNTDGEISGLVFAGSKPLGYAFIVPISFVRYFLTEEVPFMEQDAV
jgi:hypothetical protein